MSGRGKPQGYPKTGGRQKGTPNKRKLFINKHWPKDKHRIKLLAKRVQKSTYGQHFA